MKKRSMGIVSPLVALAVGACSPDATSPVAPSAAEVRGPSLAVDVQGAAALRSALDDARTRVLPTLDGALAGDRLDAALGRAEAALAANDAAALAAALQQVRATLASEGASLDDAGALVELEALEPLLVSLDDAVPASLRGAPTILAF